MTVPSARPRGSTVVASVAAALTTGLAVCLVLALLDRPTARARRVASRDLVAALGLTDLALFGEARYTRHRSLADLASAFQDGPATLDHFPSGSLVAPPRGFGASRIETGEIAP